MAQLLLTHSLVFFVGGAGYINQSTPRAGYYFSFTFTVIGATLLFLSKMYRRSAPPALFLGGGGGGRRTPSFHRATSESASQRSDTRGSVRDSRGKPCSQEPLFQRDEPSNGSNDCPQRIEALQTVRTIHQDVCTCHHDQRRPQNQLTHTPTKHTPSNLRERLKAFKTGLHDSSARLFNGRRWKNPFSKLSFFSLDPMPPPPPTSTGRAACLSDQSSYKQQQQFQYGIEWEDYWNGCLGSCNDLADPDNDGDCRACNSCVDCGFPLDDDDDDEGALHHNDVGQPPCRMHSMIMVPDAVDIPELPPQVKLLPPPPLCSLSP